MADPSIERALRRAFSHREKARQLERESARAFDAGEIESARYASLREFYANHIRLAEQEIGGLRESLRQERGAALAQFRAIDREQAALSEQLSAGRLNPDKANRQHRRLMARADGCRTTMLTCDRLLSAESAEDVGGYLDWPLTAFAESAAAQQLSEDNRFEWERGLTYAIPFVIAATVFAPWLTLEGTSKALPGILDFGRTLGLPATIGPLPARLLWVIFLLLPLAALPFAAMSRNRPSGIALILSGFVLIWITLTAIVGLPYIATGENISLTVVMRSLHLGPFLYFGGAIALILLGQRRFRMRELHTESGGRAVLIMSACMVFLMVVAASAVWLQVQQGFISYGARVVDERTGAINILLTNEGRVQGSIYAPWPGGMPGREPTPARGDVYGLTLHVREHTSDEFRVLTDSRGAWQYAGMPIRDDGALLIEPRSRIVLTLAPWQLQASGVDPAAIRIVFSRRNGEVLSQSEHEMPALRAEPAGPARVASPGRTVTGQPSAPSNAIRVPAEADQGAESAAPEATEAPPPVEPKTRVAFTGIVGDRAIIQVTLPNGQPDRAMVGVEEEVVPGWVLLELASAPPGVTLFSERSYATLNLRMGESAELP